MKKSTQELLELMKNTHDYNDYLKENKESISANLMKPCIALNSLITDKKLKKSEVISLSGIETHYAYQIFSGVKTPSRDKMIMLGVGMKLSTDEMQNLLKITGFPLLYSKQQRDNAILFGISKCLTIIDLNNLLYEIGCDLLL